MVVSRTTREVTFNYTRGAFHGSYTLNRLERSRFVGGPLRFVMFSLNSLSNFRLYDISGTLTFVDGRRYRHGRLCTHTFGLCPERSVLAGWFHSSLGSAPFSLNTRAVSDVSTIGAVVVVVWCCGVVVVWWCFVYV